MKGFILKNHEAQALASGKPAVIWRAIKKQPECYSHDNWPNDPVFRAHFNADQTVCCAVCMGKNQRLKGKGVTGIRNPFPLGIPLFGKETWCEGEGSIFRAEWDADDRIKGALDGGWKSATTMPERIARVHLTLSDVKVRRPCDVTPSELDELASSMKLKDLVKIQNLYHFTALATPHPKDS